MKQPPRSYYQRNEPGTGIIGIVPKLAPGAINPMWATEEGLQSIVERVVPVLDATRPKKTKKVATSMTISQVVIKEVELDE